MTHERDIERVLDHWLGEGPLVVGDHVIAQVAQRIEHQAQRPAWRLGQEGQLMTGALRMVAAVAAILFLAVASSVLLSRPSGPEPASPIPSPVTRSIYAANFDPGLSLQLPAGWVNTDDSYFSFELEGPSGAAAGAITLRTNPYLAANTADCSSATDVGTTEGIIAGLTADRRLVVSEPTPVVVGGVDGDVEIDGYAGEQIADEIHVAAIVLFEAVGLDEGIEADDVRLAPLDRCAELLLQWADAAAPVLQHGELGEPR